MKTTILSLLIVTSFTCQRIESKEGYPFLYRCENDEVICYIQRDLTGYGGVGGVTCKFKELKQDDQ